MRTMQQQSSLLHGDRTYHKCCTPCSSPHESCLSIRCMQRPLLCLWPKLPTPASAAPTGIVSILSTTSIIWQKTRQACSVLDCYLCSQRSGLKGKAILRGKGLTTSQIARWRMVFVEQLGFDMNIKDASVVMMLQRPTTESAATKYLHSDN